MRPGRFVACCQVVRRTISFGGSQAERLVQSARECNCANSRFSHHSSALGRRWTSFDRPRLCWRRTAIVADCTVYDPRGFLLRERITPASRLDAQTSPIRVRHHPLEPASCDLVSSQEAGGGYHERNPAVLCCRRHVLEVRSGAGSRVGVCCGLRVDATGAALTYVIPVHAHCNVAARPAMWRIRRSSRTIDYRKKR